jgi:hypothetical protein
MCFAFAPLVVGNVRFCERNRTNELHTQLYNWECSMVLMQGADSSALIASAVLLGGQSGVLGQKVGGLAVAI